MIKKNLFYIIFIFTIFFSFSYDVFAFGEEIGNIYNINYTDNDIQTSIDNHFNYDNLESISENYAGLLSYIESEEWKSYGDTYFVSIYKETPSNTKFYVGSKENMEKSILFFDWNTDLFFIGPGINDKYGNKNLIYNGWISPDGNVSLGLCSSASGVYDFGNSTSYIILTNMDRIYVPTYYSDIITLKTKSSTLLNSNDIALYKTKEGKWEFNTIGYSTDYILNATYNTSDIFGFYYNRLGLDDSVNLKIEYIPNNDVIPIINYSILESSINDDTFYDYETDGLMVDSKVENNKFISYLYFDSSYFNSLNTYQIIPNIENWFDLDGTFYLYGNKEALGIGSYNPIYFENTKLYIVKENDNLSSVKDVLISPSDTSYKIYLSSSYYENLLFYKFDIDNNIYAERIIPIDFKNGYYEFDINLLSNEYLRIVNKTDNSYNFYSTSDWLHISSVIDGHAEVIKPSDSQPSDIYVGNLGAPDLDENKNKFVINEIKQALNWFYDLFKFFFSSITSLYNCMPVQFRYFCILSFFFFIAFIFTRIV